MVNTIEHFSSFAVLDYIRIEDKTIDLRIISNQ